jgi:sec-independent protein translocase protein TatA
MGGISPGSLLLILVIVLVLFGTKRLANMGQDLGKALREFRQGLKDEPPAQTSVAANKEKENV